MDYIPYLILGILLLLLILAGLWWSSSSLVELYDTDVKHLKIRLNNLVKSCGYEDSDLDIRRGAVFSTKDRNIIYVTFTEDNKRLSDSVIVRRSIHELAHRLNKDSSEHGSMFQYIEGVFIQKALELGYITEGDIQEITECFTFWNRNNNTSEERFKHARLAYSLVGNENFN